MSHSLESRVQSGQLEPSAMDPHRPRTGTSIPPSEELTSSSSSIKKGDIIEDTSSISSPCSSADTESLKLKDPGLESRVRPSEFRNLFAEISFIVVVVLSLMMSEYFTSGFNIILPHISTSLSIAPEDRAWPTTVPNLAAGALLLPFARLCDRYGSRMIFLGGHAWLFAWSIANGFSKGTVYTIGCRAMQGIGFAAFLPAGISLLGQVYRPGPRKNKVYCLYGAFACVGFYFGIFIASTSIQFLDWRWYFWIGAVIEAVIVIGGYLAIPSGLNDHDLLARMDWWGVVTIVPGVALLVFAFSYGGHAPDGWRTPSVVVAFVLCAALLGAAVYTQGWVSSQPLVPGSIFRPKYMKRILGVTLCCNGIWSLFLFYSSLYFTGVLHPVPTLVAAWYTPLAVGGLILAILGGLLLHLLSSYVLLCASILGFLVCTLILALIPLQPADLTPASAYRVYWTFIFPAMCSGTIGINIMLSVTNVFVTSAASKRDQALIGGIINSLSYLGAAFWLGLSDAAITVTRSLTARKLSDQEQYKIGFWMGVGLAGAALCLAVTARIRSATAKTVDEVGVDEKHEVKA